MQETFDMIEKFISDNEHRFSQDTQKSYRDELNRFFVSTQIGYEKLTENDIYKWMEKLVERGLKAKTVYCRLICLKSFFKYLREEGLVYESPLDDIDMPKVEDTLPCYLERDQLQELRELVKDDPLERAIVETLYATGVRSGELVGLKKDDVNWDSKQIIVRDGKGQKDRIVFFTDECAQRLKEYLKGRSDNYPHLFIGKKGKPFYRGALRHYFEKYTKKLGYRITAHMMRHTFAAHLAEKGMSFSNIQKLLGHKMMKSTRIYTLLFTHAQKRKYDYYM
jgi:integrase/recombinase XerC